MIFNFFFIFDLILILLIIFIHINRLFLTKSITHCTLAGLPMVQETDWIYDFFIIADHVDTTFYHWLLKTCATKFYFQVKQSCCSRSKPRCSVLYIFRFRSILSSLDFGLLQRPHLIICTLRWCIWCDASNRKWN